MRFRLPCAYSFWPGDTSTPALLAIANGELDVQSGIFQVDLRDGHRQASRHYRSTYSRIQPAILGAILGLALDVVLRRVTSRTTMTTGAIWDLMKTHPWDDQSRTEHHHHRTGRTTSFWGGLHYRCEWSEAARIPHDLLVARHRLALPHRSRPSLPLAYPGSKNRCIDLEPRSKV